MLKVNVPQLAVLSTLADREIIFPQPINGRLLGIKSYSQFKSQILFSPILDEDDLNGIASIFPTLSSC